MNENYPNYYIPNQDGRQHTDVAYFEIDQKNFADPAFDNLVAIQLPAGSQILRMFANVVTPFNGGTDTLVIGDEADEDRYGAAVDLKTAGLKQFTPTGFIYGQDGTLNYLLIKRATTGAEGSAGKVLIFVETVAANKAYHTQG